MVRSYASECLMLGACSGLVSYKVRVCAAEAGRADSFMGIDHHFMSGGFGKDILIMIYDGLTVMMFSEREDFSDISGLDGIVAIFVHKVESLVEVTLVIAY